MSNRPKIVCLCGSTRFPEAWREANREETFAGHVVLSVGLLGHQEGIDMDGPVKVALDELHLRKIDLADEVLVLNVECHTCSGCGKPTGVVHTRRLGDISACCGDPVNAPAPYVGESTRREIAYAQANGKPVRYLNPIA